MVTHKDLAELAPWPKPFSRPGWVFEIKYDGFRVLGARGADGVRLTSRRGTHLLAAFPEMGACLEALPQVALDGELVMLDELGRPDFSQLRRRFRLKREQAISDASKRHPAAVFAFDLLELKGRDVRRLPLITRKAMLQDVLRGSDRIRYLDHVEDLGERLYERAEALELEGIVAKRADSAYLRGRQSGWLKIKTSHGRHIDEVRAKWDENR